MNYYLTRVESERCYLRGRLKTDQNFICDTLEFNHEETIQPGTFNLFVKKEPLTGEKRVYIYDSNNNVISKFIKDDLIYYRGAKIRNQNCLFQIGLLFNPTKLVMFSQINKILVETIEKDNYLDRKSTLTILNYINDTFEIETVTAY